MGDQPEAVEHKGACNAHKHEARTDHASALDGQPAVQNKGGHGQQEEKDQLRKVGHLEFVVAIDQALDDIGLKLNAEHGFRLADRSEIGVLKGCGVGADQNNFAVPVRGIDGTVEQIGYGNTVVIAAWCGRIGNVEMTSGIDGRILDFSALRFQEEAGCLISHGIDPAVPGGLHIEESVPQDAVPVEHGIDMALT